MPTTRFNKAEVYLLNNWADATLLEESLEAVREKYEEIFREVLREVQDNHKVLDSPALHVNHRSGGSVGIGKKAWPSDYPPWPTGLWLINIGLDNLISEDEDSPEGCVSIEPPIANNMNHDEAEKKLTNAAEQMFGKNSCEWPAGTIKKETFISHRLPESRKELLQLLLDDEAIGFVEHMVAHLETLAKFIPVVDEIVSQHAVKGK